MIRNREGLFSNGTLTPRFRKNGKVWDSFAKARAAMLRAGQSHYSGCEIIAIDITPVERRPCDLMFKMEGMVSSRSARSSLSALTDRPLSELLAFPWCLALDEPNPDLADAKRLLAHLRASGVKKSGFRSNGNCFAFADHNQAALARLATSGKTVMIDLRELISSQENPK